MGKSHMAIVSACSSEGKMGSSRKCYLICTSKFSSNRGCLRLWDGLELPGNPGHLICLVCTQFFPRVFFAQKLKSIGDFYLPVPGLALAIFTQTNADLVRTCLTGRDIGNKLVDVLLGLAQIGTCPHSHICGEFKRPMHGPPFGHPAVGKTKSNRSWRLGLAAPKSIE